MGRARNPGFDLPPLALRLLESFWSGVDVFFVLSGFLIGGILLDKRGAPNYFEVFYLRRVLRILPLAWLTVALVFFVLPVAGLLTPAQASAVPMLSYLLFVNNFWTSVGVPPSTLLSPMWSLAIEEQFYLVAPALVWFMGRRHLALLLLTVVLASPLLRLYNPWVSAWDSTLCRLDGLAMGVLTALLVRDARCARWLAARASRLAGIAAGCVALALGLALAGEPVSAHLKLSLGVSLNSLAAAAVIVHLQVNPGTLLARLLSVRPLVTLGLWSYFLYLMHMPMLFLAAWSGAGGAWRPLLALLYCLVGAWASWRWIESPLIREGRAQDYLPAAARA